MRRHRCLSAAALLLAASAAHAQYLRDPTITLIDVLGEATADLRVGEGQAVAIAPVAIFGQTNDGAFRRISAATLLDAITNGQASASMSRALSLVGSSGGASGGGGGGSTLSINLNMFAQYDGVEIGGDTPPAHDSRIVYDTNPVFAIERPVEYTLQYEISAEDFGDELIALEVERGAFAIQLGEHMLVDIPLIRDDNGRLGAEANGFIRGVLPSPTMGSIDIAFEAAAIDDPSERLNIQQSMFITGSVRLQVFTLSGCSFADIVDASGSNSPDDTVDLNDFAEFLNRWASGDQRADVTSVGQCGPFIQDELITIDDFACFLNIWSRGC
ncbi:MAG: GC-type dockerin domain-anchored protein [Planctomycetota bacterium]